MISYLLCIVSYPETSACQNYCYYFNIDILEKK